MTSAITKKEVLSHIKDYKADYVFTSISTPQAKTLGPIGEAAAAADKSLLVGGPHPTFAPEEVLNVDGVTAIVRGEGEKAAVAFLDGNRSERGLIFSGLEFGRELNRRSISSGHSNSSTDFGELAEIEKLPLPDRELFHTCPEFTQEQSIMGLEFASSRGCPFTCKYCGNSGFKSAYGDSFLRRLSVDYVIREAEYATRIAPNVTIAGFHDDIFTLDVDWLREFAQKWRAKIQLPFWVNAHPHLLSGERVDLLAKAGCVRVHIGVETGSEKLRDEVLGRHINNQAILEAANRLRKANIRIVTFVMLGIPGETEDSFKETVNLLKKIKPGWIIQSFFQPLPGTSLGEKCFKNLKDKQTETISPESFYLNPVHSWTNHLTPGRLQEMGNELLQKVYS